MVVHLTEEQETELSRLAIVKGQAVEELAREAVDRYLAQEAFLQGETSSARPTSPRTHFVDVSEVWARMERELKS